MNFEVNTPCASYFVTPKWGTYRVNGRTSLELIDVHDGELVMVATVNLTDERINEDELIIKNYSENEGVLESLQKAEIVGPVLRTVHTGFVTASVVKRLK